MTPVPPSTRSRRRLAGAIVLFLVGIAGFPSFHAEARQVRMTVTGGMPGFGGGARPAMNSKELENYASILGLDDAQKEAAKELLSSYTAEHEKAAKEQSEKMRRISEEFRETQDDDVWEQMGPVNEKFTKRAKELETTLLNDIKTLCSDAQLNNWPRLERTRRRDRTLDRGTVSGESVDLVRIIKGFDLTGEPLAGVTQQLEAYEQDLDKALIERNKIMDEQAASFTPGRGPISFDFEKMQENMRRLTEAGQKIREVNRRYTRSIEGILPDDIRPRFQTEVKRASFPVVYRQTRTQRAIEAALKFEDLDAQQKESITSLRQSYEQDFSSLSDKWAAAIMDEEKDGGGAIGTGGGGVMILNFGEDDSEKPSTQAKKARRDADRKALRSLESLLTDAQKERLPQGGDEPAAAVGQFAFPAR